MATPDTFEPISRDKLDKIPSTLPVVPLRGTLVFPRIPRPMQAGREASRRALAEVAESTEKFVLLVAQKEHDKDKVGPDDLYDFGTVAKIVQMYAVPGGVVNFVVQGYARARIRWFNQFEPSINATLEVEHEPEERTQRAEALFRELQALIKRYIELDGQIPEEVSQWVRQVDEPGLLADMVGSFMPELSVPQRQSLLETVELEPRLTKVLGLITEQVEILAIKSKIHGEIKEGMEKNQREYILREQLKAIQRELHGDAEGSETDQLRKAIGEAGMPEEVQKKAEKEVARLEAMPQGSPETGMVRSYIDTLLALPWSKETADRLDIAEASRVLDTEHFGLGKVKDRILEHLAVRKLASELRTPILCFVGPPGVGKTSLAKSIARALGRQSVRISLGGVHDEAEIRGHRRTYIGAMPGRIIQGMKNAGTKNPVFILDEIDKVGADFRGDPSAALLEVLDPEQNKEFADHYLDVPFDLSKVLFITTANVLDTVPPALRDRMEIIMLAGYTEEEKVQIALRHLVPRQLKEHGLTTEQLDFERDGLETVIRGYTREAGVRSLDRQIATISRKVARKVAEAQGPEPVAAAALAPTEVLPEAAVDSQPVALAPVVDIAPAPAAVAVVEEAPAAPAEVPAAPAETPAEPAIVPEPTPAIDPVHVTALTVVDYLGARRFSDSLKEEADEVGLVTGLAWTETGGDVLTVEATVMEGGPAGQLDLVLTGQLGNVMQESARTALSFVRSHAGDLGIDPALFTEHTLHVHVPAGAIPKDGPSAGVTMATAIASALSGRPVNRDVAMTGEVTLRGRVLPIGGLKEKTLAAHRFGVTAVLFPKENERDLDEIPKEIRAELELVPVERMHEVLDRALHPAPAALALPLTKVS